MKNEIDKLLNPTKELVEAFGEMALDSQIPDDLLRDIPVISSCRAVFRLGSGIQQIHFLRKFAAFLSPLQSSPPSDEMKCLFEGELRNDPKKAQKLIEQIVITIDRYQTELKSAHLGRVLVALIEQRISHEEYNFFVYAIEQIHPAGGFGLLGEFYDFHLKEQMTQDEDELQSLATEKCKLNYSLLSGTGLLDLPSGAMLFGARGGARLNNLGVKYCEEILSRLESNETAQL
jgi:hypothetical protein